MRDRMQELWDGAVPMGVPCPQADPAAVKRRVNAALNAVPSERRAYMRHKIRFAAAAAAIAGPAGRLRPGRSQPVERAGLLL